MNKQFLNCSGWVKGLSMWPNLIPGDILSAEEYPAAGLKPGMIAVFSDARRDLFFVHRVVTVQNGPNETRIITAGDRSRINDEEILLEPRSTVRRITGVLRRGNYRTVTNRHVPAFFSSALLVRLYCGIVRKLLW